MFGDFAGDRSLTGSLLALGAFLISFSPSLLPRPWLLQGIAAAVSAALGYAIGALLGSLVSAALRFLGVRVSVDPARRQRAAIVAMSTLAALSLIAWVAGHHGRSHTAKLVGLPPPTWWDDTFALGTGILATGVLIAVAWLIHLLYLASRFVAARALPRPLAGLLAASVVVALVAWTTHSVLAARLLESVSASAASVNLGTADGLTAPTSPLVSGGPGSTQPWDELGRQGRAFTAKTPTAARISAVTGAPAVQPIRIYAAPEDRTVDVGELVATALTEMDRTDAWARPVIVLLGTTGSGWVDEHNVQPVEYLTGGNCASVALQYSFLPSPVQFLTNRSLPQEVGAALVHAVRTKLDRIPAADRPKLYVAGESLGSFGMQAAFKTPQDMIDSVDGAVWVGTPNQTTMWRELTGARTGGSPEVVPVIDNGTHIRFVTTTSELRSDRYGRPLGQWKSPRIVYLQHASDPVVWWDPSIAWSEPDWIGERAGRDVDPHIRWWPLVTMWMISVDFAIGNSPPPGHGHTYKDETFDSWAAVLNLSPSAAQRTAILQEIDAES